MACALGNGSRKQLCIYCIVKFCVSYHLKLRLTDCFNPFRNNMCVGCGCGYIRVTSSVCHFFLHHEMCANICSSLKNLKLIEKYLKIHHFAACLCFCCHISHPLFSFSSVVFGSMFMWRGQLVATYLKSSMEALSCPVLVP